MAAPYDTMQPAATAFSEKGPPTISTPPWSGVLSRLTISWFYPVLRKGARQPLQQEDLLPLPEALACEQAYPAFATAALSLQAPPGSAGSQQSASNQSDNLELAAGSKGQENQSQPPSHHRATEGTDGEEERLMSGYVHRSDETRLEQQAGSNSTYAENKGEHSSADTYPEQHLRTAGDLGQLIWRMHGRSLLTALALIYGYQAFVFAQPVLLKQLIDHLVNERHYAGEPPSHLYVYPVLLFISPLLGSLCKAQCQLKMIQIQITLRTQLTCAVYHKCLRLSAAARQSMPSGRVVNLMSADVAKICDFTYPQLSFMACAPLAVTVALIMLWFQIGWATFIGAAILAASTPVSNWSIKQVQKHRNVMLTHSDVRIKLVSQFLAGVRVIKMYVWERAQKQEIEKARAKEMAALRAMIPAKVSSQTLLYVLPQLAGVASFLAVGLTNPEALSAGSVFSSLVLFQIMRFPLLTLSTGLVEMGAAYISACRIAQFMSAEEQEDYVTRHNTDCDIKAHESDTKEPMRTADINSSSKQNQAGAQPLASQLYSTPSGHHDFLQLHKGGDQHSSSTKRQDPGKSEDWNGTCQQSQQQTHSANQESPGLTCKGILISQATFTWPAGSVEPTQASSDTHAASKRSSKSGSAASRTGSGWALKLRRNQSSSQDLNQLQSSSSNPAGPPERLRNLRRQLTSGPAWLSRSFRLHQPGGYVSQTKGLGSDSPSDSPRAAPAEHAAEDHCSEPGMQFKLSDISLQVTPGQLVCVVGRVGSGKSSLVSALLGEMHWHGGQVVLSGSVAYVAQQAWIMSGSVVDNVTMGLPLDEARWAACVEACCLGPDLAILPAGRDTEIGEKGVNLSGGQKQRLALARAVYQEADINILDDPLSAVDVHVGSHIFTHCIRGALSQRAVLLVTNQVQYLPMADHILVMDGGAVVLQGTYAECLSDARFAAMLEEFGMPEQPEDRELGAQEAAVPRAGQSDGQSPASSSSSTPQQSASTAQPDAQHDTRPASQMVHIKHDSSIPASAPAVHPVHPGHGEGGRQQDLQASRPSTSGSSSSSTIKLDVPITSYDTGDCVIELQPQPSDSAKAEKLHPKLHSGMASGCQDAADSSELQSLTAGIKKSDGKQHEQAQPAGSTAGQKAGGRQSLDGGRTRGKLVVREDRELGQVKWQVYRWYLGWFGWWAVALMLSFWSMEQSSRILTNTWLAAWSRAESQSHATTGHHLSSTTGYYATGYGLLAVVYGVATLCRSTTNNWGSYFASKGVHADMLAALMQAPVSFFESTPIGRVLNRLSRDVDEMDYNLALYQQQLGNCIMRMLATTVLLCVLQPVFIGAIIPLFLIYSVLQKFFRMTSIELQRLESLSRSPVYANFGETMAGLDTIRAYMMQGRFIQRHYTKVNLNSQAYLCARVADEWLSLRLDLIGATIILSVAMLNIIFRHSINPQLIALALSEAIDLTSFLNYAVKVSALVESRYNAVERLQAYSRLQPEGPEHVDGHIPPNSWPTSGQLVFTDVWMRYRPGLEPVLKGVSFIVQDGEKVGIAGRTGSGKSSIIVALFRIVEAYRGAIVLDGRSLLHMGLGDARSAIAAIPQEPVLFSGSVRSNLDPWGQHQDADLWDALDKVALKDYVRSAGGLGASVSEGGDNWSVGQRQLMCVARALLRRPKLLVADEATASVDPETDALIQRTIRSSFKGASVLTIAHRLNTILDSDKILIMDAGRVAEFGPPSQLLQDPSSAFGAMARDAGLAQPVGSTA